VHHQSKAAGKTIKWPCELNPSEKQKPITLSRLTSSQERSSILFVFQENVGPAIWKACQHDADADAIHLTFAAKIVHRDFFNMKTSFTGTFHS